MSKMTLPAHSFSLSRPLPGGSGHDCWERLTAFDSWPLWNLNFRNVYCLPTGEPGRGSVLELETVSGRKFNWTVVHWEPEVRIAFLARGKTHDSAWCFELPADSVPGDPGLRLLLEMECRSGAKLIAWWLRWRLRRQANRFLDGLVDGM